MTKTASNHSNAINWIITHSAIVFDSTEEFNGELIHATTRQFTGNLPGRMGDEIRTWFKNNGTMRDTNRQVVYSATYNDMDISVKTGAFKSSWNSVNFVSNKYETVYEIDEYNAEWLAYLS